MVGQLISSNYKYEGVVLASGAKVTAPTVTIESNKVARVESGHVLINDANFSFSIYKYGVDGKRTYNLSNVPENVDGKAIVSAFVDFVEAEF